MKAEPSNQSKYWAFISYSHRDKVWGDWLHNALETYRVPRGLVGKPGRDGPVTRKYPPVFRDREELPSSSSLNENITQALNDSRYLIVICSPHAAVSRWVNEEILHFKSLGREDRVLCLIVDGEPNATDKPDLGKPECFPPGLRYRLDATGHITDRRTEPIAADARPQGDGKNKAKLRLLAGLIGVNFDTLYRRERRRAIRRNVQRSTIAAAVLAGAIWWLLQKGEITLSVSPTPAQRDLELLIDNRPVRFDPAHPSLKVRPGTHALDLRAANYEPAHLAFVIGRFEKQDRAVALVHEKGTIDVEVYPSDAQIEIDGKPFGSRVDHLDIDAGEHNVRALKQSHYETARTVVVPKGELASEYLSLKKASPAWSIERFDVQGGFVNFGDVDGDGIDDFVHNFITEIGVISGRTGELIREIPTHDGNNRGFIGADLGGNVGKVALSVGTRNAVGEDGKRLTDLICLKPDRKEPFWIWYGPAPRFENAGATVMSDANGDGVADIVIKSVDNRFFLVDGAKGTTLRELQFGVSEWWPPAWTIKCRIPGGEGVTFCGTTAEAGKADRGDERTYHGGAVSLSDGRLVWQNDFPGQISYYVEQLGNDGVANIILVSRTQWKIIDGATGEIRYQGSFPPNYSGGDLLQYYFADLDGDGTAEWIMLFRDSAIEAKPLIAAVRLKDNKILWQRQDLFPAQSQLTENDRLARADDGGLILRTEHSLLCLDPRDGKTRWEQEISTGDTSGAIASFNGDRLIFLGELGKGVRCLSLDGKPRWGVSFNREFSPMIVLADENRPERSRLVLNKHTGNETTVCEIACVLPPENQDWVRRVIPDNPATGSPGASEPRGAAAGTQRFLVELTAAPRGEPNLICFDAETGARVWTGRELFETAYRRYGDPLQSGETEAAPAFGTWPGSDQAVVGLIGRARSTLLPGQTTAFIYRLSDGKRLAAIPLELNEDAYATGLLADADGDGQTDFLIAKPNNVQARTGINVSGDVTMIGGAQKKQVWRREVPFADALAVTTFPGEKAARVIVTSRERGLWALRGSDGEVLWKNEEVKATGTAAVLEASAGTKLYVVADDGTVAAIDPASGKVLQTTRLANVAKSYGPVVLSKSAGAASLLVSCGEAGIVALDPETFQECWRSPAGQPVSTLCLTADLNGDGKQKLIACTDNGDVIILSLKDGTLLSREPIAEGEEIVPYGAPSFLPAQSGKPAKLFVTCSPKDAPKPPAAILYSKTLTRGK